MICRTSIDSFYRTFPRIAKRLREVFDFSSSSEVAVVFVKPLSFGFPFINYAPFRCLKDKMLETEEKLGSKNTSQPVK